MRVRKKFESAAGDGIDYKHMKDGRLQIVGEHCNEGSIKELEEHASVTCDTSGTANLVLGMRSDV